MKKGSVASSRFGYSKDIDLRERRERKKGRYEKRRSWRDKSYGGFHSVRH